MARPSEKKESRQVFLDVLRVAATMAVVMMHVISGVLNGGYDFTGYERRVRAFRALVDATSWSVPLFLMISGYLFLNPKKEITWKDAICKYCRRILLALLLFGVPFAFLESFLGTGHFEFWMIPQAFWNTAIGQSWAHLWYLYLILILYAVTPALKAVLELIPAKLTYLILLVLLVGTSVLPFLQALSGKAQIVALPSQGIYLFYYLCGYVYAIRRRRPDVGEASICLIGLVAVIGLGIMLRFEPGYNVDMAYGYPLTFAATLMLFDLGWALEHGKRERGKSGRKKTKKDSEAKKEGWIIRAALWLSPLCFGIYLIHPVFLNFFYKYKNLSIMNFRFFIGVPLFFLIAFVGSIIGSYVMRLIPPLRKYVL